MRVQKRVRFMVHVDAWNSVIVRIRIRVRRTVRCTDGGRFTFRCRVRDSELQGIGHR